MRRIIGAAAAAILLVALAATVALGLGGSEGSAHFERSSTPPVAAPAPALPPTTSTPPTTATPPTTSAPPTSVPLPAPAAPPEVVVPAPEFPQLTPDEISLLIDALAPYPGTTVPVDAPSVLGDLAADDRIRQRAEARGYRRRPLLDRSPVTALAIPVHPDAAGPLDAMVAEARDAGLIINVRSGHRGADTQRLIFRRELDAEGQVRLGRPYTAPEVASGDADAAIDQVLRFHSVPGYSRHHSGLAIDFDAGPGPLGRFTGTPAEQWLRADNFLNAKRFGFLPSYPEGAAPQGPQPESWEYVYVGTGSIRCAALHIEVADPDAMASCPLGQ